MPGINGKMDEIRSAYGLLNLRYVDGAIERRRQIARYYQKGLRGVRGIRFLEDIPDVRHNYSYFPVFVDAGEYGMSRDALYEKLKLYNIFSRRYFYPLISTFSPYRGLNSAKPDNLPVAAKLADRVICLPIYDRLEKEEAECVVRLISEIEGPGDGEVPIESVF
jgi:dTDP-4-amino-4,6-dideoxygalactose transaminase